MNWTTFKTYELGHEKGFESLCNQIFERWVREKFKDDLVYFTTVRGDGGDGGVEAFAELRDGSIVGLQAKWFPDGLSDKQVRQIDKSIRTAMSVRPQTRMYIVCLPSDLTSLKKVQEGKNAASTEESRWNVLKSEIKKDFPSLELILWDDHNLTTLLQRSDLEGAVKFWFEKEIITSDLLKQQFEKAKVGWLRERYVPDLHTSGHINLAAQIMIRSDKAKEKISERISILLESGNRLTNELRTLQKVLGKEFGQPLKDLLDYVVELTAYLTRNQARANCSYDLEVFDKKIPNGSREIYEHLEALNKSKARILSEDIKKHLDELYKLRPQQFTSQAPASWNSRFRIFSGDPGTGKTHALANITESSLSLDHPAIIIQAKSITSPSSWQTILQTALGVGTDWSESQILNALESRAAISEVRSKYDSSVSAQAHCCLICVDGLDETQDWDAWQNRVKEIEAITAAFPRVRFLVTGRDYFFEHTGLDGSLSKHLSHLPPEGDVPVRQVFDRYIAKYQIDVSEVPWVKWSIRSLLVLRLFCNQYKGRRLSKSDHISTTIGGLLRDRFKLIEREFVAQIRPQSIAPDRFLLALRKVAQHFMQNEDVQHEALASLIKSELQLEDGYINSVIDHLLNHGLLVSFKKGVASPLNPGSTFYQPSFQPIIEFLLALEVIELVQAGKKIPDHLEYKVGVLGIATTMLFIDHDVLPAKDGLWGDILSENTINELRCLALSSAPPDKTKPFVGWVKSELKASMPKSRFVLSKLCYPVCHVPNHPLGPKLVDEALREFELAGVRDIIWSGLDYVPENHGAVWEGHGPNPIRDENYSLGSDENFDGLPLLHAWNLTSIDNSVVGKCSKNLVRWGSKRPDELAKLLKHLMPSNDPQLEEALLLVVLGVTSMLRGDQNEYVKVFADWILEHIFSSVGLRRYRSSIIRAVGRSVVERAYELNLISEEKVKLARPPFNLAFEPLPLSVEAAKEEESYGPIWHDLAWYVIKGAYKGFFEHKSEASEPQNSSQEDADIWINEKEVEFLLSEALGPLSKDEKDRLEKALEKKRAAMKDWEKWTAGDQEINERLAELLEKVDVEDPEIKEALEQLKSSKPTVEYEKDAAGVLEHHSKLLGFEITPHQLAVSAATRFAENLGWNEEVFRGNLNGSEKGEILGADFAITRQHFMASHGSKSRIMAFGEKYIWCAVHYLQGYFSDYIAYSNYESRERVTDYSKIEDFINPAQPDYPKYGSRTIIAPCLLSPDEPAIHGDLPAAISNWVKNAALPDLKDWILPDPVFTKDVSGSKPLCLIHCFNSHTDMTGLGDSLLWVHSFLIDESEIDVFERSLRAENGIFRKQIDDPNSGLTAGVECDCYISPRDVIFMSWKEELSPITLMTVIKNGKVSELQMHKCVCEVTASTIDGERTFHLPTKIVRKGLGITRGDGLSFEDESGNRLAFNVSAGEAYRNSQDNLYVDRDKFLDFAKKEKKIPVWLARFDRRQSTKAFHSVGRVEPRITYLSVYYIKDGKLLSFQFDRSEE